MQPRHIVVSGLMGSGKTTVGTRLAEGLGWPYRDSDADLRSATGSWAREIAARDGIDTLHALELRHLVDALATPGPSVISAAASTIDAPEGRAALDDAGIHVVYLHVSPAVAAGRVTRGDHRPSPEGLAIQAERRDPRYRAVADQVIDTDVARPDAIVRAILERLPEGPAPG